MTADGIPRITDFGLAKRLWADEDSVALSMTETGQILGTAGYMSPEQAEGKTKLVGTAADIYALGAVLYALLTSRAPFVGESQADTIRQVIHREPVSPRVLNPALPRDLETICLKCLNKERHERYGTAQLLADDLAHFLAGEPVRARPVSTVERAWRWCRRNAALAGLCAVLMVSLLIGSGVSWYYKYQSDRRAEANLRLAREERIARNLAEQRKLDAEGSKSLAESRLRELQLSERESRRNLYCAHMSLIQSAWEEDEEPGRAEEIVRLLERQIPAAGQEDLRSFEWHFWNRRINDQLFNIAGEFRAATFDPDGSIIATGGRDKIVRLWDAETGAAISKMKGHDDQVYCLAYSKAGELLVSGSWDETVRVWDVKMKKEPITLAGHTGSVLSVAVLPDGKMAASGSMDGTARIWDLTTRDTVAVLGTRVNGWTACAHVAFSSDGHTLAFAQGNTLETRNVEDKSVALQIKLKTDIGLSDVCISPDSTKIAAGDSNGMLYLWDSKTLQELLSFKAHVNSVSSVKFSPDGQQIASGAAYEDIRLSDTLSGKKLNMLKGNQGGVADIAFCPNGTALACVCSGYVRVLKVNSDLDSVIPGLRQFSGSIAFSADSRLLAISHRFGDIALLGLNAESESKVLKGRELSSQQKASKVSWPIPLAFHPGGEFVLAGSPVPDWSIRVRSVNNHEAESVMTGHEERINSIEISADGATIATASADQTIKLWNTATKVLIQTLRGHFDTVNDVAFSPDGQLLASVSNDGCVKIWDTKTGLAIRSMNGKAQASSVAFSPSGKLLAAGNFGELRLWDCDDDNKAPMSISFHGPIYSVAFTPDGQRVAACGNGPIKLWDTATGGEVLTILTPAKAVTNLAFSPDGTLLAASTIDSGVLAWEAKARSSGGPSENGTVLEIPGRVRSQTPPSTGLQSQRLVESARSLTSVQSSSDDSQVRLEGHGRLARLRSGRTGELTPVVRGHESDVRSVTIPLDGQTAVVGSEDKILRPWDSASGKELDIFAADGIFSCVRCSKDGKSIFATNGDDKARAWKLCEN